MASLLRLQHLQGRPVRIVPSSFSVLSRRNASSSSAATNDNKDIQYPHIFTPLPLRGTNVVLPNRVLMGSMHTGLEGLSMPALVRKGLSWVDSDIRAESEDDTWERWAAYFVERAKGGCGLMVTGGVSPNRQGWTGPFSSQLTRDVIGRHRQVTEAVHDVPVPIYDSSSDWPETVPSRICLQLLHTGRYAYHPWAVSASATQSPISPFQAKALKNPADTVHDFVQTAEWAAEAGYDGVEVMGSEGYLLSQFFNASTNLRSDEYDASSIENRSRLALEIVRGIREACGSDFAIMFRLSLLDLIEKGSLTWDEAVQVAIALNEAGATILNTGIGWHESRVPTIATCVPRAAYAFPTQRLKEALKEANVDIPVVATNRINHPETAEDVLSSGTADMISMARPFLADPDWMVKSAESRENEINTCIACNQACLDHVFVGKTASCLVNPRACHETEIDPSPLVEESSAEQDETDKQSSPSSRPVVLRPPLLDLGVVGAGPSGCAFAIAAAQKGHRVTLYDKDVAVGGQFHMAKRIPGKEEFHETLRYFRTMLDKHDVQLELETELSTLEQLQDRSHEKWIVATGVTPRDPKIPGQDHPSVLTYIDVLKYQKPVGKRVAVIGAGGIGFDVSEYLLYWPGRDLTANEVSREDFWKEWGIDPTLQSMGGLTKPEVVHPPERQIYLLQRKKSKLGAGLGKTTGWIHRSTLNRSGAVEMINSVKYERIDENGNLHIDRNGEKQVLEVDNIVLCAGQVEQHELATIAKDYLPMYTIGGAYAAGELDAKRAIDMGVRLAVHIHEPEVVPGKHVFGAPPAVEEKVYKMLRSFA